MTPASSPLSYPRNSWTGRSRVREEGRDSAHAEAAGALAMGSDTALTAGTGPWMEVPSVDCGF